MVWPFSSKKEDKKDAQIRDLQQKLANTRQFAAASVNRLTASWGTSSPSMDWDLQKSLRILQARSRDICTNNDYGRKFLQMCATNVVGPNGFRIQVRVMETPNDPKATPQVDKAASAAIENAFWEWCKKGNCDITGKHSFYDLKNLYIKGVAREGEVLLRKVYGKGAGKFGFQLQILDVERLDVDKNERQLANGNIIKMGVEIDTYGRPVNYHLRIAHPGDNPYYSWQGQLYEVVPAADIYHHFIAERPEQNRGFPWLTTAMLRLNQLGGYEEAAIVAARVGASKMGFFTAPDGDGTAISDAQEIGDGTAENPRGQLITEADPGVFPVLPEGYGFEPFNPDYPHAMYKDFVKTQLRSIASGLGVAYNTLANDLEGVNFSSIRSGVIEERDCWMAIQKWMIEQFLDDVFSTWLKFALISGAIKLPNGSALPASKYDKFNNGIWQGRRWQWVDPRADAEANISLINNNLRSREDVIAEMGGDIDETWTQLSEEKKQMEALGIEIISTPAKEKTGAQDQNAQNV